MHGWRRRIGLYVGAIFAILLTFTFAYNIGMRTVENEPQSLLHSLELILLYMFTVGVASEYPSTEIMTWLVLLMNITGQLIMVVTLIAVVALIVYERSWSSVRT